MGDARRRRRAELSKHVKLARDAPVIPAAASTVIFLKTRRIKSMPHNHDDAPRSNVPMTTPDFDNVALRETLSVGYRFSSTHTFDPEQVSTFALAAGDDNPIHHFPEIAATTRFGKVIVSGTHTTALMMGLVASHLSKLASVVGVRFAIELLKPVFADEQVTLTWEITSMQPHRKKGAYLDLTGMLIGADGSSRLRIDGRVLAW